MFRHKEIGVYNGGSDPVSLIEAAWYESRYLTDEWESYGMVPAGYSLRTERDFVVACWLDALDQLDFEVEHEAKALPFFEALMASARSELMAIPAEPPARVRPKL